MKPSKMYIACILLSIIGCNDNPVNSGKHENRSPVMFSLTFFPEMIGPSDSVIVICNAMDPDGDTLVYDWITDARLRIKGSDIPVLYHTRENSRIFYPTQYAVDTVWIQCFARDVKGKSASGLLVFRIRQSGN
jgi:hypothetical protein